MHDGLAAAVVAVYLNIGIRRHAHRHPLLVHPVSARRLLVRDDDGGSTPARVALPSLPSPGEVPADRRGRVGALRAWLTSVMMQ
jgi:hypothetical protein